MKFIKVFILSLFIVTVYMVFLNPTKYAWVPLIAIVLMLLQLHTSYQFSYWAAFMMGFLMDIHFQYIGPYIGIYMGMVFIMQWLKGIVSPRMVILSTAVLLAAASIWSVLGQFTISGIVYGFQYYYLGLATVYQLVGIMVCGWGIAVLVTLLIRTSSLLHRYAGR